MVNVLRCSGKVELVAALDVEHEVSSIEVFHHKKEVFLGKETRGEEIRGGEGWGKSLNIKKKNQTAQKALEKRKESVTVRVLERKQLLF